MPGVLVCGHCHRRMRVRYHSNEVHHYCCQRQYVEAVEFGCHSLAAKPLDQLVTEQVPRALEPAAVALSLEAQAHIEQERQRLEHHWQQRLQRAQYDVELAQRRYASVAPSNRLVAATLKTQWEQTLSAQRQLQEQYDRFLRETPLRLREQEQAQITALAGDMSTLWNATGTTHADRKHTLRCVIERVVVDVRCDRQFVAVTIHWAGGYESAHQIVRPVATYAQLQDFEQLMDRLTQLREAGHTAARIAEQLNAEGFRPPKRSGPFCKSVVYQLLKRRGLLGDERSHHELLGDNEGWLTDLARKLQMSSLKLRDWAKRGWVHSRKTLLQGWWIPWADPSEVKRLRKLLEQSRRGVHTYTNKLKTPKQRPNPS